MFIVFYIVKIVYICVCMTYSTSYCLCDTVMDPWNVCIYVSDFAMSHKIFPADFVSINVEQSFEELIFEVSIKIFLCHVQVIMYWNVTGMREKRNTGILWENLNERDHLEGLGIDEKW
jgi:hypothetical protein